MSTDLKMLARLFTYALAVEHTHMYYYIYVYKILLCIENVNDYN